MCKGPKVGVSMILGLKLEMVTNAYAGLDNIPDRRGDQIGVGYIDG